MATEKELRKIVNQFESAQNSLVLQSSDFSLETIAKMVEVNAIDASPHYQRRERWKHEGQSLLIESFLLNVPVPPVYLAEDNFGTYSVIDGKQRITAISGFMRNQYRLKGLIKFGALENLYFRDLPRELQNALNIRPYIRVVTLLKQTSPELKYEVFTRLNSGGEPLLAQEIRNALYRGELNDAIMRESAAPFLRQQLKIVHENEAAFTTMQDVELVLRFLTLDANWDNFSGDMRRSMDNFMSVNLNLSAAKINLYCEKFSTALERCNELWGVDSFKRPTTNSNTRDQFLSGLYDAQMIAVTSLSTTTYQRVLKKVTEVRRETKALFRDARFDEAVRRSTNSPSRVKYRVEKMINLLEQIGR